MIKTINLAENIEERLLAICQQIGREENELIEEAILNYLEDLEDSRDAQDVYLIGLNVILPWQKWSKNLVWQIEFDPKALKELKNWTG